ncbi:carbamoyl-phosphate synthase large subunit [Platysternon megacephalum]|uniref:Carbamoyl-phosphate synthase large subunit n=1 Tax=Platysternon megacephalum TaxID=55544 RepID=A0A4D9DEQ8_9SAUR|nr:carbamoyl-phosphate synthase large subunit [Platysternon megacephalum]
MSRHASRQKIARDFGATHIVEERGEDGVAKVKELTDGIGADCVLECVGTESAILQAMQCTRPGGQMSWVGLPHIEQLPQEHMFWKNVGIRGGVAPVREYLPTLLPKVLSREIEPGKVFDLELPLSDVAQAYKAMDERRAIKVLLRP